VSRFDVCVVGSANQDLIFDVARIPAPGETVLARSQSSGPGGKGLNQAVAAARAGASVAFVGSVGSDASADALRSVLADGGVVLDSLRTVPGPTGSAVVLRAADGENAIVVAAGANGETFEFDDEVRAVLAASAVVLAQQEVPASVNAAAVSVAAAAGAQVVLNAAPALALDPSVLEAVTVLVVNEHELDAQLPGGVSAAGGDPAVGAAGSGHPGSGDLVASVAARAAVLVSAGRSVVVTLGGDGAVCVSSSGATHIPVVAVDRVRDTTGAGDAFCGALCAALARGLGLVEAARFGGAAGALAVRGFGAASSMADADEIAAAVATSRSPRRLDLT
jgi:ribokinase